MNYFFDCTWVFGKRQLPLPKQARLSPSPRSREPVWPLHMHQ
ncbi:hypothetical protein RSAG8_06304, partial [Rhizoctonia solani AG-8 WAC10335]